MPPSFHPNLTGKVTPETKLAIDTLFDRVQKGATRIVSVEALAKSKPSLSQIGPEASRQLTIAGKHPLDLEGLLGTLSQPQKASATPVNSLPGPNDPLSQNGQIVYMNHRLYWFDGSTDPGVWRVLGSTTILDTHANRVNYPPADYQFSLYFETDRTVLYVSNGTNWIYVAGTYRAVIASLPVDLVASDVGFEFYATDLGRGVYWNGAAFLEAPQSLRIGKDARRINVAAAEGMLTGGGASPNAVTLSFGDNTTSWAFILGTPVAGTFTNRFAVLGDGSVFGFAGAGPTVTYQISVNGAFFPQNTGSGVYSGNGSPEGVLTAEVGSIWLRRDGGTDSSIYVKTSGSGATGWLPLRDTTLLRFGTGDPEGSITAGVGAIFQRTNGGPDSVLYVKTAGSGNTGWLPVRDTTLLKFGTGDPEGVVTSGIGSIFQRTDGGTGTSLYIKESGSGNTGWVPVNPSSAGGLEILNAFSTSSSPITTTVTDVAGCSITLDQDITYVIIGVFDVSTQAACGQVQGTLEVNGVPQQGIAVLAADASGEATVTQVWVYINTGSNTAVLRVAKTINAGTATVWTTNCTITAFGNS